MLRALARHWPEYLMEAWGLGVFMVSAGLFGVLLESPGSPVRQVIEDAFTRRALGGLAMGLTAVAIIYSPWGKRSGAHINPGVTLSFLRLGKVEPWDAALYVAAQFAGGVAGVVLASAMLGAAFAQPPVQYAVTIPGMDGAGFAFGAEFAISFLLFLAILATSNTERAARYTGLVAGALVALYITVEQPLSGMSMNPARTFGSALPAGIWSGWWIYFTAPPLGMLLAAELYARLKGRPRVRCAKLHHQNSQRCIFRCGYAAAE